MVAIVPAPARLPATYEQACEALATCVRIDECKNWSDKAEALASYARQRDDRTLVTMAMKIAGRAMRRCGELLKEIEPAKPGPVPVRELDAGAGTQFGSREKGRTAAAQAAGLSHRQQHQAIRIANVPAPVFEEMIERPKPATLTELADVGKKTAPRPAPSIAHLHGADPKDFYAATHGAGALKTFVERTRSYDPKAIARGSQPREHDEMREHAKLAAAWIARLQVALGERPSRQVMTDDDCLDPTWENRTASSDNDAAQ